MVLIAVFVLVMLIMFILLLVKNYRRCPPNRLLVIYGKGTGMDSAAKVVHGGAVFVVPLFQDYCYLSLEPIRLELPKTLHSRAADKGVKLPDTWTVAISTDPNLMQNAAVWLLALPMQEVMRLAEDLILGRIEKRLDQLDNATEQRDSVTLLEKWAAEAEEDLAQVGLKTIGYR